MRASLLASLVSLLLLGGCSAGPFFPDAQVDVDGDGVTPEQGDCDDRDPTAFPRHPERCDGVDNDCDGLVDGDDPDLGDQDGDGADACADCDDGDPARRFGANEICDGLDNDCDGELPAEEHDEDGDGVRPCAGDCDDEAATIHPGAIEGCDGVDNDCSGGDNEADGDGDGALACADCDDVDPARAPGLVEICDGFDNDCDGALPTVEADLDADGAMTCAGDCDDGDATRWPAAPEQCNGVDDDCDGEPGASEADGDSDGVMVCEGDCDDGDGAVAPGLAEVCDGLDTDCDGAPGAAELDEDSDGVTTCAGDCDDRDPLVAPGLPEACDGLDTDCVGGPGADEADLDGDATMPCEGDCDDLDAAVGPGLAEACDGLDTDCVGGPNADEIDGDADGALACVDCDDADGARAPSFAESCDGADNDCDGAVPPDEADGDGDGARVCAGDCDDGDAARYPANPEACTGVDDDCDGLVDDDDLPDGDGDGDGPCVDCDDGDPAVGPSAPEQCGTSIDEDCDGLVDEPTSALSAPALFVGGAGGALLRWAPTDGVWSDLSPASVGGSLAAGVAGAIVGADVDGRGHAVVVRQQVVDGDPSARALHGLSLDCTGAWPSAVSAIAGPALPIGLRLVATGDLDGDGAEDLVALRLDGAASGETWTFLADGAGGFVPIPGSGAVTATVSGWSVASRLIDLDGDGAADLVACSQDGVTSICELAPGLGDGTFDAAGAFAVLGFVVRAVALGDLDGDGAQDLIAGMAAEQSGAVWVLAGDGQGGFALPEELFDVSPTVPSTVAGPGRGGIATFDADGDGDDDLALTWDPSVSASTSRHLQVVRVDGVGAIEGVSAVQSYLAGTSSPDSADPIAFAR